LIVMLLTSFGWWAESTDVEGWSAVGNPYAEVVKLAEESIRLPWSDLA
jgi:predicted RNase H-like HicB family nuclease